MATRFWTCYWQNRFWRPDVNAENEPVCHSAGNSFTKRGISPGDVVYIVSQKNGQLLLGGKMTVGKLLGYKQAVKFLGNKNIYPAEEHLIGVDGTGTSLDLHRQLSPEITKQLRFKSKSGPKEAFFISETNLDNQAMRGVRELVTGSAMLLDRFIEVTDGCPRTGELITVTDALLGKISPHESPNEFRFPEEVPVETTYREGNIRRVEVNRYERDTQARSACIAAHGTDCCICGFNFGHVYGTTANGYIHVHHLRPLAEVGKEYVVNPVDDLRPVCPNCHAVLHLGGKCSSIEEVRNLLGASAEITVPFSSVTTAKKASFRGAKDDNRETH